MSPRHHARKINRFRRAFTERLEPRLLLTALFYDGFEDVFPGAWTVGSDGANISATWGDNDDHSATGSWSAFAADNGNDSRETYDNSLHTFMRKENISLVGQSSAVLSFKYFLNSQAGFDFFDVYVHGNSGVWTPILHDSGDDKSLGFQIANFDLSPFLGQSNFGISFEFTSDANTVPALPAGVWVDDVAVLNSLN